MALAFGNFSSSFFTRAMPRRMGIWPKNDETFSFFWLLPRFLGFLWGGLVQLLFFKLKNLNLLPLSYFLHASAHSRSCLCCLKNLLNISGMHIWDNLCPSSDSWTSSANFDLTWPGPPKKEVENQQNIKKYLWTEQSEERAYFKRKKSSKLCASCRDSIDECFYLNEGYNL